MTVSLKHKYVNPVADIGNPNETGPDEWNDEHDLLLASNKLLGRATAGSGAVEEIGIGTGLAFDGSGNLHTTAGVSGDVSGPAGGTNPNEVAFFADNTGKLIKSNGVTLTGSNTGDQSISLTGQVTGGPSAGAIAATVQSFVGLSVIGRASNASGAAADIAAASDYQILRRSGTTMGFGAIDLSQSAAVGSSKLPTANLADMATNTIRGRLTAGTGAPEDLTPTQVTSMLDLFTSALKGLAPASGGGTANFLRADGSWAAPTFTFNSTLYGNATWGSGSSFTWTFDSGAGTDQTWLFGNQTLAVSNLTSINFGTATVLGVGSIELGNASDTTLTRSAAGALDVEGHTVLTDDQENQACTAGCTITEKDLGTISSGTTTLDMGDRPMHKYTNNGAHTLAPGAVIGATLIAITNGASAGAITTSGWTKVTGDAFTTTNANKFLCHGSVSAVGSLLIVTAMQ